MCVCSAEMSDRDDSVNTLQTSRNRLVSLLF